MALFADSTIELTCLCRAGRQQITSHTQSTILSQLCSEPCLRLHTQVQGCASICICICIRICVHMCMCMRILIFTLTLLRTRLYAQTFGQKAYTLGHILKDMVPAVLLACLPVYSCNLNGSTLEPRGLSRDWFCRCPRQVLSNNDTSLAWCLCLALAYLTSVSLLFAHLPCSACTRARLHSYLRPRHRSASAPEPFINLLPENKHINLIWLSRLYLRSANMTVALQTD